MLNRWKIFANTSPLCVGDIKRLSQNNETWGVQMFCRQGVGRVGIIKNGVSWLTLTYDMSIRMLRKYSFWKFLAMHIFLSAMGYFRYTLSFLAKSVKDFRLHSAFKNLIQVQFCQTITLYKR